jgi:putative endonuclease
MQERQYFVYIMASRSRVLYVGITGALARRVYEHKYKAAPGFTCRYNVNRLVYYEATPDVRAAIAREKQIKGWLRSKKIALIESANPEWRDLSEAWAAGGELVRNSEKEAKARGVAKGGRRHDQSLGSEKGEQRDSSLRSE